MIICHIHVGYRSSIIFVLKCVVERLASSARAAARCLWRRRAPDSELLECKSSLFRSRDRCFRRFGVSVPALTSLFCSFLVAMAPDLKRCSRQLDDLGLTLRLSHSWISVLSLAGYVGPRLLAWIVVFGNGVGAFSLRWPSVGGGNFDAGDRSIFIALTPRLDGRARVMRRGGGLGRTPGRSRGKA